MNLYQEIWNPESKNSIILFEDKIKRATYFTFLFLERINTLEILWYNTNEEEKNKSMEEVYEVLQKNLYFKGNWNIDKGALQLAYHLQGKQCLGENPLRRAIELTELFYNCLR